MRRLMTALLSLMLVCELVPVPALGEMADGFATDEEALRAEEPTSDEAQSDMQSTNDPSPVESAEEELFSGAVTDDSGAMAVTDSDDPSSLTDEETPATDSVAPADDESLAITDEEPALEEELEAQISADDDMEIQAEEDTEGDLEGDGDEAVSLADATIVVASQTYTGAALEPEAKVTLGDKTLKLGEDFTASYRNNRNAGTATLTITGCGGYTGSATTTFLIRKATITGVTAPGKQAYTASAVKPKPVVRCGNRTLKLNTDYTLSYKNNTKVGKATVIAKGKGNYQGMRSATFQIVSPAVRYKVHCQTYGWEKSWQTNGKVSGTTGESKRLEGIRLTLGSGFPVSGGITYRTHVQTYGWEQTWAKDGGLSGTTGEAKRLEAIQIKLTGEMANKYNVWYRVHAQRIGWMAWAKNGQVSGTSGLSWRLEAIQVVILPKGSKEPGNVANVKSATSFRRFLNPGVTYRSAVAGAWSGWVKNGKSSGTTGKSSALSAIQAKLSSDVVGGSVRYRTKPQNGTWSSWSTDGATSGVARTKSRLQGIRLMIDGEMASYFDVWYRAHVKSFGWLGWAKNGALAGTGGPGDYIDAYQVRLVAKGAAAPGSTVGPYRKETVRQGLEMAKSSRTVSSFGGFSASDRVVRKINAAIEGIRRNGYDVGFICMDLATFKGVAYNCDGVFYGASSIKAPCIASVVSVYPDAIAKYQFYMQETLFYSWDYAYKEVYYGYGKEPMRKWCRESGARSSIAESLPWANYSARDLALMWGHTYTWYGRSTAMEKLGTWCERPNISTIHDTLGGMYRTRSKGGWISDGGAIYEGLNGGGPEYDVTDDGGIVYADNGDYVVAIMSSIPANHDALHALTAAIDAAHTEM